MTLYASFLAIETVVLFFFQSRIDLASRSAWELLFYSLFALILPALIIVLLFLLITIPQKIVRKAMIWVTLIAIRKAAIVQSRTAKALGIGNRDGELVLGLEIGTQEGATPGARFRVATVSGETLGFGECIEVFETSCLCMVSDRINTDYWESLEGRMLTDPSPPAGVTFTGYVAEEILDTIRQLLEKWEDSK